MNINFEKLDKLIDIISRTASAIAMLPEMILVIIDPKGKLPDCHRARRDINLRHDITILKFRIRALSKTRCSDSEQWTDAERLQFLQLPFFDEGTRAAMAEVLGERSATIGDVDMEFISNLPDQSPGSINFLIKAYRSRVGRDLGGLGEAEYARVRRFLEEAKKNRILSEEEINFIQSELVEIEKGHRKAVKAVSDMLEEWENLANTDINRGSLYTISDGRKTDFIKIISAMYDCRMFGTTDGRIASNKKELIKALGQFFNTEIDDYSGLISKAKDKTKKETFLEIFDNLKKKGQDYYGED
jgi:hypothetical protein